jgi:hypothetical protein
MSNQLLGPQRNGVDAMWHGLDRSANTEQPKRGASHCTVNSEDDSQMSDADYARQHQPGAGIETMWRGKEAGNELRAQLLSGTFEVSPRGGDAFVLGLAEHQARSVQHPASVTKTEHQEGKPPGLPSGSTSTVTASAEAESPAGNYQIYGCHTPSVQVQQMDLRSAAGGGPHPLAHPVSASAMARASMSSHVPPVNRT